jgi:Mg-chelatase subunit ChlD
VTLGGAEAAPQSPRLDVLFLLDATGSMGDEIAQIQRTIASIAQRIDNISPRPELRLGLVSYRDRGDEYVTRVNDFTPDVAAFHQLLMSTYAEGGGDNPEALNEALNAAVERVSWADNAVRLVFLVADAPPHLDYQQDYDYVHEARTAVAKGIKLYPIAASNTDDQAEYVFRQLAQQTLARFIFLTYQPGQDGGAPGDTTTHDVDPEAFTVERLDDLVVQVVERELALAQGVA